MSAKEKKIVPLKTKLGYTIGSIGDSTAYNIVISFFSFFLTTVAGISPAIAGMITSIAIWWDAITDPILGTMVDSSRSKKGKRRPFIGIALIPMAVSIIFLFMKVDFPQVQKNIYYLVVVLIFWTSYTAFNILYYSLGSVITNDDDERAKIAGFREVMGFVGIFCGTSVPTFLVGKLTKAGWSEAEAWSGAAVVAGLIVLVSVGIMWRATKGYEPLEEQAAIEKFSIRRTFSGIVSLMKTKPYVLIILSALFCNVYMTLFNSDLMYYTSYVMNISESSTSILYAIQSACSICLIPFITKMALHHDKRNVYVVCMAGTGAAMILAKFIGITTLPAAIAYIIIVGIGTCAYWLFIFNFLYDVVDLDEFKSGKKRDGIIMSYYSLLLKLGGSAASLILGLLMQAGGFNPDAAEQGAKALETIESLFTIYPGVFMLLAGLVMLLSPVTRKRIEALREAQARKVKGLPYDTTEFEEVLK